MVYRIMLIVTHAVAVVLVVSSLALASSTSGKTISEENFEGTVTRINDKGWATITTREGTEYVVQAPAWQVGDKVECGQRNRGTCEKITTKTK